MTLEDYNKCVDSYADNVYRFVLKNIKDREKARDIVQDTFEKFWVNKDNVNADKAKSYLFTAAYHTLVDSTRKQKKQTNIDDTDMRNYSHSEQYSDLQEVLHSAINRLPDVQKSAILLRDYEGYSYDEIGEILGLNESQVKVYIYRARVFLKEYIGTLETVL